MIEQYVLDNMKEDAERGVGADCEDLLDLILDINRLTRIMPHIGETCEYNYASYKCEKDRNVLCDAPCINCKWELKD